MGGGLEDEAQAAGVVVDVVEGDDVGVRELEVEFDLLDEVVFVVEEGGAGYYFEGI